MGLLEKVNTGNKFRYLNLNDLNTCYDYYKGFATKLVENFSPANNTFNRKEIKILDFDYLWESSVNAGSVEGVTKDCIEINEGTILQLYGLFYKLNTRMMTVKLSQEIMDITEINSTIIFENESEPARPIKCRMILSDNIMLNNIAEYMAMFAIKFIIAHEIGHAFNGHTKYYLETRDKIAQDNSPDRLDDLYLDLQTMEMDADSFAICRVIDDIVNIYNSNDKILDILKDPKDIFKLLIYSVHGIFYIFREGDKGNYRQKEHPPSFMREALILDSMKAYFKQYIKIEISEEYFTKNLPVIEKQFCQADNADNEKYIKYLENFGKEAAIHAKRIMDNYSKKVSSIIKSESRLPIEKIDY